MTETSELGWIQGGLHRGGCLGCEHDPAAYPPCWSEDEIDEHQEHMRRMTEGSSAAVEPEHTRPSWWP